MKKSFFFESKKTLVLLDQAVYSGSSFLTTFLMARLLAPAEFGLYGGYVLVLYLMISAGNALVIQPFQVLRPQYKTDSGYLNFAFALQLTVALAISTGMGVVMRITSNPLQDYWLVASLTTITFLLHDFFRKVFLADDKIFLALVIDIVSGGLQVVMIGSAFFYGQFNLSYALLITCISFLGGSLIGLYFVITSTQEGISWRIFFAAHIKHGKWLLLTAVIQWWSGNFFVVAAGVLLGPIALGAFRLVQSLFGILNVLLQTYENYVLPEAVRIFSVSVTESKRYLRQISFKGMFLFGSVLALLFIFSDQVMALAGGSQFVEYSFVVKGMSLLYFIIFIGYPVRIAIRMMVLNRIFFIGYMLSFCFSALSFNYLLKEYQLSGAIVGLIVNQCILILFWQYHLAKRQFVLWK
jgi:O-antigen/teichoic acid export membrane protein